MRGRHQAKKQRQDELKQKLDEYEHRIAALKKQIQADVEKAKLAMAASGALQASPTNMGMSHYQIANMNMSQYMAMRHYGSYAAQLYGTRPAKPEPLDLPKRRQEEVIVAYKRASIVFQDYPYPPIGPQLYGIGQHAAYKPEDRAQCVRLITSPASHEAPDENCTCGFYAMDKQFLGKIGSSYPQGVADLEVELWGKVIKHRDGYRAEYQRVLGVYLDPACGTCKRSATALASDGGIDMRLYPRCDHCVSGHRFIFTPTELANAWGVEVRWGSIQ